MKFIIFVVLIIAGFMFFKSLNKNKHTNSRIEKEINPDFRPSKDTSAQDITANEMAKEKTREILNEKFNLQGKHDDKINTYAGKVIDKVGSENIIKAVNLFKKFKK